MKDVIEIQIDKKLYAKVMDFLSNDSGGAEIEFFIDSSSGWVLPSGVTSFKAREGMTWGDWIESEYNTYGFFIIDENSSVHIFEESGQWKWGYELISEAYPAEKITPNRTYNTSYDSSPDFQP